jgi:hypothetical protein
VGLSGVIENFNEAVACCAVHGLADIADAEKKGEYDGKSERSIQQDCADHAPRHDG